MGDLRDMLYAQAVDPEPFAHLAKPDHYRYFEDRDRLKALPLPWAEFNKRAARQFRHRQYVRERMI